MAGGGAAVFADRLYLRPVAWGDLAARRAWGTDPDVMRHLVPGDRGRRGSGRLLEWTLALRPDGRPVGLAQLILGSPEAKDATLGLAIGERRLWGRGLGTRAVTLVLDHAFLEEGCERVVLEVAAAHTSARRLYERCGFRGVLGSADVAGMEGPGTVAMVIRQGECRARTTAFNKGHGITPRFT